MPIVSHQLCLIQYTFGHRLALPKNTSLNASDKNWSWHDNLRATKQAKWCSPVEFYTLSNVPQYIVQFFDPTFSYDI